MRVRLSYPSMHPSTYPNMHLSMCIHPHLPFAKLAARESGWSRVWELPVSLWTARRPTCGCLRQNKRRSSTLGLEVACPQRDTRIHSGTLGMCSDTTTTHPLLACSSYPSTLALHTTCTLHTHYMHTTCTLHAHYMHTTCTPHAHYMHTTCTPHAHYMHIPHLSPPRPPGRASGWNRLPTSKA